MILDGDRNSICKDDHDQKDYNKFWYSYFISQAKDYGVSIVHLYSLFLTVFFPNEKENLTMNSIITQMK